MAATFCTIYLKETPMRRVLSSLLAIVTLGAGLGFSLSAPASAAPGDVSIIRNTDFAPAGVPNARIARIVRLAKSDSFLVVGRDTTVVDSNLFVWKLKGDLTVDSSFPAVDLGTNFSHPSSANSTCTVGNNYGCIQVLMFANEAANTFYVGADRQNMKGTNQQTLSFHSMAVGSLSTGTIIAQTATPFPSNGITDLTPWAAFTSRDLGRETCVGATGATYQSAPLENAYPSFYSMMIRPDGSILIQVTCFYSTDDGATTSVSDYQTIVTVALKPDNGNLVVDTSFGTNGYLKIFDDPAKCNWMFGGGFASYDQSVTSNTSTKIFNIYRISTTGRTTTPPNRGGSRTITTYDGCEFSGASRPTTTAQFVSFTANGTVKKQETGSADEMFVSRWVIDSSGRWNGIAEVFPADMNSDVSYALIRMLPDGSLDSSLGTSGMQTLSNLPSNAQIGNTTVPLRYQLNGVAVTESGTLFVGFGSTGASTDCYNQNQNLSTESRSLNPYYFDVNTGLIASYGSNGLGQSFDYERDSTNLCTYGWLGQAQFVNAKGQPSVIMQQEAIGSQQAGIVLVTWDAAAGVVGGGDGSGELSAGGNGRVDNKIYSRKLPSTTEVHTSLKVLKRKDLKSQRLISRTPKICTIANGTVLMLRKGTCSIGVVDKTTNKIVRSLTTKVDTKTLTVGSSFTASDPVYFKRGDSRLTKKTRTQVRELVETAKEAKRIYVVGHAAQLFDDSVYNYAISRNRARHVAGLLRAELRKAKVKVPVVVIAEGSRALLTFKKTETAQSKNRRVEIYFG